MSHKNRINQNKNRTQKDPETSSEEDDYEEGRTTLPHCSKDVEHSTPYLETHRKKARIWNEYHLRTCLRNKLEDRHVQIMERSFHPYKQEKFKDSLEPVLSEPLEPVLSEPLEPVLSEPLEPVLSEPGEACSHVRIKSKTFDGCKAKAYDGGGKHENVVCDECMEDPVQGIRWKCLICADYDLCTKCYMSDKHNLDHKFQRILGVNSESAQTTVDNDFEHKKNRDNQLSLNDLLANKTTHEVLDTYYEVSFASSESTNKKIGVLLWGYLKNRTKVTYKHSLYLIFACPPNDSRSERIALMKDVIDLARKTKLPCYIEELRVLFHSGSTKSACIHYKTKRYIIEELIKSGFHKFERGDVLIKKTVEIGKDYFRGMVEYVTGEDVLPVIISIRNGGIRKKILKRATNMQIPIIRFQKKNNPNIRVLLSSAFEEMVEYEIDMKMPWRVQIPKTKKIEFSAIKKQDQEIEYLSEVKNEVENLISYLLIAEWSDRNGRS